MPGVAALPEGPSLPTLPPGSGFRGTGRRRADPPRTRNQVSGMPGCAGPRDGSSVAGLWSRPALDLCGATPQNAGARRLDGRCRSTCGRGKSGLHGNTVPVNGRRGRPQGQCHRKQTARPRLQDQGSSAGKGETVRQERTAPLATGAAGQTPPGARPNRGGRRHGFSHGPRGHSRPVARVGRARRAAMRVPEEWPSRVLSPRRTGADRTRLTGRLAAAFRGYRAGTRGAESRHPTTADTERTANQRTVYCFESGSTDHVVSR